MAEIAPPSLADATRNTERFAIAVEFRIGEVVAGGEQLESEVVPNRSVELDISARKKRFITAEFVRDRRAPRLDET